MRVANISDPSVAKPKDHSTNAWIPALFRRLCHENVTRLGDYRIVSFQLGNCSKLRLSTPLDLTSRPRRSRSKCRNLCRRAKNTELESTQDHRDGSDKVDTLS